MRDLSLRWLLLTDVPSCVAIEAGRREGDRWGLKAIHREMLRPRQNGFAVVAPNGLLAGFAIARFDADHLSILRLSVCSLFDYGEVAGMLVAKLQSKLTPRRDAATALVRETDLALCRTLAGRGFASKLVRDAAGIIGEDMIAFAYTMPSSPPPAPAEPKPLLNLWA